MSEKYLSLGTDFVGLINKELRTLSGTSALANELIQNAEDAKATRMSFDFTDEALIVVNDSTFSSCGDISTDRCNQNPFCDFHRFRNVASGNKRKEAGNIGAFGIGFTSVYQITDRPELISGNVHWTINPMSDENRRISVSDANNKEATVFRLPWAKNKTDFRKELSVAPISEDGVASLLKDLRSHTQSVLLFLSHVESIEILKSGNKVEKYEIVKDGSYRTITDANNKSVKWQIFEGDFGHTAVAQEQFRRDRTAVSIAIPDQTLKDGLLFAFLPLENEKTELPFHLNADFFPSPERKSLLFDNSYQAKWNCQALTTAIEVFSANLSKMHAQHKPQYFWEVLNRVWEAHKRNNADSGSNSRDAQLKSLWPLIIESVNTFNSVLTSRSEWKRPSEVRFIQATKEAHEIILRSALEDIGLDILHLELLKFRKVLNEVGVKPLEASEIIEKIKSCGLRPGTSIQDAPDWFRITENRTSLLTLLKDLFSKTKPNDKKNEIEASLKSCPVAIDRENQVQWPKNIFKFKNPEILKIFLDLDFGSRFLAESNHNLIVEFASEFTITDAIGLLEKLADEDIATLANKKPEEYQKLIEWLIHEAKVSDEETKTDLRNLQIWPTSDDKFEALDSLAIPGSFDDPIGLAKFVDLGRLGLNSDELMQIGAIPLTFLSYIRDQVKDHFDSNEVSSEKRERLFELVRKKQSDWKDDDDVKSVIASLPLVKCSDGEYYPAQETYFDREDNKNVLGDRFTYVSVEANDENFYLLLGVAKDPRVNDLLKRINDAITPSTSIDRHRVDAVIGVIKHIGKRWSEFKETLDCFHELKDMAWLPEEGSLRIWNKPKELFSPKNRLLFESVGKFVALSGNPSSGEWSFLKFLEVEEEPSVGQVIEHLLNYSVNSKKIDTKVYEFLNSNIEKKPNQIKTKLGGTPIIWNEDEANYLLASQCFWKPNTFGKYRYKLPQELEKYKKLFTELGVKEEPDSDDAIAVLKEISHKFVTNNDPLDEESKGVVNQCWLLLNDDGSEKAKELSEFCSVINNAGRLELPSKTFFDNFTGIAEHIGLSPNVILIKPEIFAPLQSAGVRFLSKVISLRIIERSNLNDEVDLNEKLGWTSCFERITAKFSWDGERSDVDLDILKELKLISVENLVVQYFVKEMEAESGHVAANSAYDESTNEIIFKTGEISYLAGDLARILLPSEFEGKLSSNILHILKAENKLEAHKIMDGLNIPKIDSSKFDAPVSQELSDFSSPTETEREQQSDEETGIFETAESRSEIAAKSSLFKQPGAGNQDGTDFLERDKITHSGPDRLTDQTQLTSDFKSNRPLSERRKSDTDGRPNNPPTRSKPKRRGRLLSYVESVDNDDKKIEDLEKIANRHKIDSKGILAVMEFEKQNGRFPLEMHSKNPGFDIKSFLDEDERQFDRYIEVKSLSDVWGERGVSLTKPQFEKACLEKDKFWLYIVESAGTSEPRIYAIQNPSQRITHYFFDHGWKDVLKHDFSN